ncbi:MAG: septum formation initiator family protein [Clostridia bacterium]
MRKNVSTRYKEKKVKKKISVMKIVGILFMTYFLLTIADQQTQINKYNSQITMYETNINNTNSLTSYYSKQKTNIKSDEYIENVAREKLGYIKPNEKIFVDANR